MKDLLNYVAKNLVEYPNEVNVEEEEKDNEITLTLHVAKDDVGRIIGKHGRVAKEIRTLMKSMSHKGDKKITVEISE